MEVDYIGVAISIGGEERTAGVGRGGGERRAAHEVSSPTPPRVIPPRSGVWEDAGREQDRGRFPRAGLTGGLSPALPPPQGRGRSAKRGQGGGSGVWTHLRRLRPSRDLTTRTPAPAREPFGRGNTVFLSGEGSSPPRPPPPGDSLTVRCMGGCRGRTRPGPAPGQAFPGISPALPLPGGGEERAAGAEQGGRDRRAVYGPAFPGSHHENPRSCAGALGKGRYGFCRRGGGSLPGPSPGDTPTVRCMGRCWQRTGSGPAPGPAFPGISPALPPPGGGEERMAGAGGGVGARRTARGRGGSQENSVWNAGEWCPGSSSPAAPFMGSRHENPAPAREH